MVTSLHSLAQLLDCTVHSCYVRRTSTAFFLAIVLMISGALAPLPGTKGTSALAQDETCLDAITDTDADANDPLDQFYAVTDKLKQIDDYRTIKEKIDIFTYSENPDGEDPYTEDVITLHVSLQTPRDSECGWGHQRFYCYRLRADLASDKGELMRERGHGGMYISPGKIFEAIRESGDWRLEDNRPTFIIVGLNAEQARLETYSGSPLGALGGSYYWESNATEIDIPSSGKLSFTLAVTTDEYDSAKEAYVENSSSFKNFRVKDNSVFAIDTDRAGNPRLRPISCQEDGSLR